jgi:hypothetical protein
VAVQVVNGAQITCSFGMSPSVLVVLPARRVTSGGQPAATIQDYLPANITTFGMCTSLDNPTVDTATSLANGVLTPMPCKPVIVTPWTPGSETVQIGGIPALTNSCTCECDFGGVITIGMPGQTTTMTA